MARVSSSALVFGLCRYLHLSGTAVDGSSWPQRQQPPVPPQPPRADIGIVSLCAYDSLKTPLTSLSTTNTQLYAAHHGYTAYISTKAESYGRHPAWGKVCASLGMLRRHRIVLACEWQVKALEDAIDKHEWLMWLDCDSIITNYSRRLEELLPDFGQPYSSKEQREPWGESIDLILSEDGAMFNTGPFPSLVYSLYE